MNVDSSAVPEPSTLVQLAAPGSLIGKPDPAKLFPEKTVFTPYAYLHNTSPALLSVNVLYAPLQGGSPTKIGTVAVAPYGTVQADVAGMLRQHQLAPEGGVATLVFAYQGRSGQVDIESGSIDQTRNYVFGVSVVAEQDSISKTLCYWTTSGDYDSAIAVLNYTDAPSDELLTFYFAGGMYKLPLHLAAGETKTVSLRAIQNSQLPDADGNTLPLNITQGSAILSSASGETEKMSVAIASTSFSVKNATCGYNCTTCNGATQFTVNPNPLALDIQGQGQMQGSITYNTGNVQTTTSGSWSTGAPSVASVSSSGNVTGLSTGQTGTSFSVYNIPIYASNVCTSGGTPSCPSASTLGGNSPVSVGLPDHVTVERNSAGFPAQCPTSGVYVRQILMQLTTKPGTLLTTNYSVQEQYQNLSSNTCGNGAPVPSSCSPIGNAKLGEGTGQFNDVLTVASNVCSPGFAPQSGCGFSHISVWTMCSNNLTNPVWTSPRITKSNGITVNGNNTTFSKGTQIH